LPPYPPPTPALPSSQVHDEVILEGPRETSKEAKQLVVQHMANPWKDHISRAVGQGLRPPDPYGMPEYPKKLVIKDDGSKLLAPVEPLLVSNACFLLIGLSGPQIHLTVLYFIAPGLLPMTGCVFLFHLCRLILQQTATLQTHGMRQSNDKCIDMRQSVDAP
jgi:hypothetical protein